MNNKPLVSIITVVLNGKDFISSAIESVLSQSYPNIEHIVIDGGSTDGTLDEINKYKGWIAKMISGNNQGLYDGMNQGISIAAGEIIGILNADDLYYDQNVIKTVVESLIESGAEACWGDLVYVKRKDPWSITRVWKSSEYRAGLFQKGWHPPHPTFFVPKSAYDKYGLFRLDLSYASDYELMLRFLERHKIKSTYIPKFLVKMREGGISNWRNVFNVIRNNLKCYKSWKLNELKASPLVIVRKPLSKIPQLFAKEFRGRRD